MYILVKTYKDGDILYDESTNITGALYGASIYLEDPDCIGVKIMNTLTGEYILDYSR